MTTAFAWLVRGRPVQALGANPAGGLLAAVSVALVPWLVQGAVAGRTFGCRSPETLLIGLVVATVALSLLSWLVRLSI